MLTSQAGVVFNKKHPPHSPEKKPAPRFGALAVQPFSVVMQNNQVMNREFITLTGFLPGALIAARNRFEVFEMLLDNVVWGVLGIILPVVLNRALNQRFEAKLRQQFKIPLPPPATINPNQTFFRKLSDRISLLGRSSPLQLSWEWLDASGRFKPDASQLKTLAANIGHKSADELGRLLKNRDFVRQVLRGKSWLLFTDLMLLLLNGQKFFLRNWMTRKVSGQQGFSGEFNYASDDYRRQQSEQYERSMKKRMLTSLGIGFLTGVAGLLGLIRHTLSVKNPGRLMSALKKIIPAFNYHNTLFCGKWILAWATLFNYAMPNALAARDKHELRESLTKNSFLIFFWILGDTILSMLSGKAIQKWLRRKTGDASLNLVRKGPMGLTEAIPLQELLARNGAASLVYKWGTRNYWASLIGASLMTGLCISLLNNWYTKKKVLAEQAAQKLKLSSLPLNHPPLNRHYAQRMQILAGGPA